MKQLGLAVLLLLATLYYALGQEGAATGVQCGPVQCFADQSCCNDVVYGPLCFGSANYSCLSSEDGTNRLCPQQFGVTTAGVCGSSHTCYYVEQQACVLGFIVPRSGGPGSHVEEPSQPPQPQPTPSPAPQPTQPTPEPQPTSPPQPEPTTPAPQPPEPQPEPTTPEPQPTTPAPQPTMSPGGEQPGTEQPPGGSGLAQGGQAVGGQCSNITCTSGSCCQDVYYGGLCFTAETYACLTTDAGAQRLCPQPAGESAGVCGNVCYFTATHSCVNGEVTAIEPAQPAVSPQPTQLPAPQPTQPTPEPQPTASPQPEPTTPEPQPTMSPGGEQPPEGTSG